ncbi:hypothetical protein K9M79_02290 [Candidatus Woesearchaeota archaeon]|nr:hypothetical protein [Candidatus Woesearchaeota archaeon]
MKAVSLVSSGIDSPVATYLMIKKGFDILPLYFSTDHIEAVGVLELMKKIGLKSLTYIDFSQVQEDLNKCDNRYRCVLCKRMMYRIADKLKIKNRSNVLVTGENLAQVASQTLHNMHAISESINTDVIRPLLCYDKKDIIDIARKIGTYDISVKYNKDCSFVPRNPATKTRIDAIHKEEEKLDIKQLVQSSILKISVLD